MNEVTSNHLPILVTLAALAQQVRKRTTKEHQNTHSFKHNSHRPIAGALSVTMAINSIAREWQHINNMNIYHKWGKIHWAKLLRFLRFSRVLQKFFRLV